MSNILKKPVVTEKSAANLKKNKYTFVVSPDANKIQVKQKITEKFNVKVESVNIINRIGKVRRKGRIEGRLQGRKFAVVTVADGQSIDDVKGLF